MTVTIRNLKTIAPYSGENAISGIQFRAVRQALGVTAWGMNVLEMAPQCESYPEHDHTGDGQEEVYLVLEGRVVLQFGTEEKVLVAGDLARVGPKTKRKLVTRDSSAVVLALGATPGKAFVPTM
jgi:uncharacterized cupin superfamily protein